MKLRVLPQVKKKIYRKKVMSRLGTTKPSQSCIEYCPEYYMP